MSSIGFGNLNRRAVARTSKSAVSQVSNLQFVDHGATADFEIGDTADWETRATAEPTGSCTRKSQSQPKCRRLPSRLYRGFPNPQSARWLKGIVVRTGK